MYQTLPNFCQEKPHDVRGDAVLPRFCRYFLTRASAGAEHPTLQVYSSSSSEAIGGVEGEDGQKAATARAATITPTSKRAMPGLYNALGAYKFSCTSSPASAGSIIVSTMMLRHVFLMVGIVPTPLLKTLRCGLSAPQATKHLAWRRSAVSDLMRGNEQANL